MHDTLGVVHVNVRANMKRMIAKWKNTEVHISVPGYTTAEQFEEFLRKCEESMPGMKPAGIYTVPMSMQFEGFRVEIRTSRHHDKHVSGTVSSEGLLIEVPADADVSSSAVARGISKIMCSYAKRIAPRILIREARAVSERVGRRPLGWEISNGHRTLGRCSARGVIALSYVLVFLPVELRDYVVCHELAHLSEMNHSANFHRVCDSYCDGRESELESRLRSFKWPIER